MARTKVGTAIVVSTTLLATLSVGEVARADQVLPVDGPVECVDVLTEDGVDPVQVASHCGHDVEVAAARTPWDTYIVQPNGQIRWESSTKATRTKVHGQWEPISSAIVADPDGGLTVASGVYDIDLHAATPGEPFASLSDPSGTAGDVGWDNLVGENTAQPVGDRRLGLTVPFGLGQPVVDPVVASRVLFPVLSTDGTPIDGASVVVTVEDDGTGLLPILKLDSVEDANAVTDASQTGEIGFGVEAFGDMAIQPADTIDAGDGNLVTDGVFNVVDPTVESADGDVGVTVWSGARSLQWDSSAGAPVDAPTARSASVDTAGATEDADDRLLAPVDGDLVAPMDVAIAADGDSATVTADESMFTAPGATGPFYVDPQIKGSLHEWTAIKSGWPSSSSSYKFTDDEGVGRCPTSISWPVCDRTSVHRLMFEFSMSGLPDNVDAADVSSAKFSAFGSHAYDCVNRSIDLYKNGINVISSSTSWDTRGIWSVFLSRQTTTHRAACPDASQKPRRIYWTATSAAKDAAAGDYDYLTLGLRALDETDEAAWKRYTATTLDGVEHRAMLVVTFNRPPFTPSKASMRTKASATDDELACVTVASDATPIRTQKPYLQAQGSDPDGADPWNQTVSMKFIVVDNATNDVRWESGWTSTAAGGSTHRVQVGKVLSSQRIYRWRAQARDSTGQVTGWSDDACMIRPDTTAPNPPIVSSNLYKEYPAGVFGGINQGSTFTFRPDGSSDVTAYKYSFNDGEKSGSPAATADGSAQVTFAPGAPGPNAVDVWAKDSAGLWSPEPQRYEFWVGYPARDGLWHLDEATGLTSQNDVTTGETAGDLTLSSTGLWQNANGTPALGAMRELRNDPGDVNDHALVFDQDTDVVRSQGPAVAIDKSYTISAFMKVPAPGAVVSAGAAVSQEGENRGSFHLGYSTDGSCPDGEPCWAFWVKDADTTDAGHIAVRSDTNVEPNTWVNVAAQYDATTDKLSIRVCDPNAPLDTPEPIVSTALSPFSWTATGPLRLGSGMRAGAVEYPFRGYVDDVRVYREPLFSDTDAMNAICTGAPVS
ncbi:LamG-like jellyroll fold domain-containing protein [Promicromonospora sp. NPDC090134]|uniref:LamG-like jellyroll fold domain-containing protein n=1 Tax=Promicromonospora sp. NPDC090134 TaxID=3364408 RepID=UPI00381AD225